MSEQTQNSPLLPEVQTQNSPLLPGEGRGVRLMILLLFWASGLFAQKISFDPVDWKADQPVTMTVDFTATSFHNFTGNLYLWTWYKNSADEIINGANNGSWTSSAAASQLTNLGSNKWSITFTPATFLGVNAELLKIGGFNFLIKNQNGSQKSDDYGPVTPWSDTGVKPNACWWSKRRITLVVDVTGTTLANNAGPLHYWGWYNTGSGDVGAAQNGTWSASSVQSQMTQIATNVWAIDLDAPTFFGTSASNLSASTIYGLVKNQNGTLQTGNFGKGQSFKQYHIYQTPLSRVSITPSNPADNVPVTVRFTAVDDLVGYTDRVYLHTGVATSAAFTDNWDKSPTNWDDTTATAVGLMTNVGTNQWEYTLPSIRSFYGLTASELAYKVQFRIRTKNGGYSEGDGCQNATVRVNNANYLEVREPVGTILTKPLNEPFRITAYSPLASDYSVTVNGNPVFTGTALNRATTTFTPTMAGTYTIVISSTQASTTLTKTLTVTVCGTTSTALAAPLPAGLKYGVNYNAANHTRATLVLHAPTENIKTVHVVGDFNNWMADCNYLMNWDATKKVFWKEITGLTSGQEYVFQYLIDGKTRVADSYTHKVSDPWNDASIPSSVYPGLIAYPDAARPKYGETPTIASVLQTNRTPYNWQVTNFKRQTSNKLNIYQLHFRDFTTEGTYLAAIQKLDYLKRLGINAIETLPVSEFEGNNSWGYNPNFYFAADKAYGTENDFKLFVDECHKRGMAVLGDIVLNHAFGTNPMARMYWNDINSRPESNNPWFNVKTNFDNPGANWGNDFNHTSPHTQAFADSVIYHWITEYKIDGIRFDFTKGFGNTPYPNPNCGDPWGGCYDAARVAILKRMTSKMWSVNNGATGSAPYVIMEHLATLAEDKELADYGISLWSGVSPNYKYSEIAMGYAPTVGDPNKSNVSEAYYKNKTFNMANWISYMESHDEERLAYKALNFGNGTVKTDPAVRSQFLQAAAVMNLLLTGPRQIWQFGELGYDFSIDFNQRTGRKPVRWDYFDDAHRKKIYGTYAKLFWLRNYLPQTFHRDIDNPGGTKTDFVSQFKRYHFYSAVGDTAVTIVANTANSVVTGDPSFNSPSTTTWYDFMTGTTQTPTTSLTLQPGEFRVFINKLPVQAAPTFALTSAISPTVGHDTTRILVQFDKPMLKTLVGSDLGENVTNANISSIFELRNAANNLIPIGGSINFAGNVMTIDPTNPLPVGSYTLNLLANTLQNYGSIKVAAASFAFSVQVPPPPCLTHRTLVSTADDFSTGSQTIQVSNAIEGRNKVTAQARIVYDAKNAVELKEGFLANPAANGVFEAKIGGCN